MVQPARLPALLLAFAPTACAAPPPQVSSTVCNQSAFPWPDCQPSCAGESGGTKCVHGTDYRDSFAGKGSKVALQGGCLNCSGVVCTMSVRGDTAPPETAPLGQPPRPGKRVQLTAPGWEHTKVRHTLLLPEEFNPSRKELWPMLVELPGNGCGYGGPWPEGCGSNWTAQGWGIAQGKRVVWLTLPFVTRDLGVETAVQTGWWGCSRGGEPFTYSESCLSNDTYTTSTTVSYLKAAVADVVKRFRVDPHKMILLGHSRGSIGTQAVGGADDEIASMWAGIIAASHYDGAEHWPYSNHAGGVSGAVMRAKRLAHVPKFLVGECNLQTGIAFEWLRDVAKVPMGLVTAVPSGFRDHTGFWILRPSEARTRLRDWVFSLLQL